MFLFEKIYFLKNVSMFSRTDENVLQEIAKSLDEINLKANVNIFQKGEQGKTMYIIIQGSVRIHDADYTFAVLEPKQVFGEYALLDTELRSASATTVEDSTLLVLDQKTFYEILVNHKQILQGILQVLVERSRHNNHLQEELSKEKQKIQQLYEQLKQTNEEIKAQNEEILQQQAQIEQSNQLLSEKNQLIISSINYARQIQTALIPKVEEIQKLLPNSFVFYQPKDIVSGDFYWISDVSQKFGNEEGQQFMIASIDCTGHGVPGAFMSMLGSTFLNQIINIQGVTEVDAVLNELKTDIRTALRQETTQNKDGMDIALCLIDKQKQMLEFAGAKTPIFYIQNNELYSISGDNIHIGGYYEGNLFSSMKSQYTKHHIPLNKDMAFYMFSDGFRDQFGWKTRRKFLMKGFKELLLEVHQLPFEEQATIVGKTFEEWKGHLEQTDDVILIGFKVD
jgi:serine phosphatase RsbU (regulator of sigma subunit)